jgi:hypothetical protein
LFDVPRLETEQTRSILDFGGIDLNRVCQFWAGGREISRFANGRKFRMCKGSVRCKRNLLDSMIEFQSNPKVKATQGYWSSHCAQVGWLSQTPNLLCGMPWQTGMGSRPIFHF